jgi:zinc transport system ATP-binding protein
METVEKPLSAGKERETPPGTPVVAIENLTFSYGGPPALEDVDLTIDAGDFACVVGPNGGGKTTLIKLILGLLEPGKGRVRLFGEPPARSRDRAGYMPQQCACDVQFPVRVRDVVLMGRLRRKRWLGPYTRADKEAALAALREVELFPLRDRLFAALSGGERQRVLIARALATDPEILILDEPVANVDIAVQRELHDLLSELNQRITIILTTHDIGFVSSYVKSVICVNRRVVKHPTSEITGEIIAEMYGTDVRMVRHNHRHGKGDYRG